MGRKASKVQVTIMDIHGSGECHLGFKKGDTWLIENNLTPTNFCMNAFETVYPAVKTMRYGAVYPWGESEATRVCCPDFNSPVIFEIRRLPSE